MRYKAKARVPITKALPLVQCATSDEATLWNIEQEKGALCVEFTSDMSLERLEMGFAKAAKTFGIEDNINVVKLR